MKTRLVAAVLVTFAAPALAQSPAKHEQHHPGRTSVTQAQATPLAQTQTPTTQPGFPMPMGQMMHGQGRGMMGRFSREDMSAFVDAHVAALKAGLKLSAEQEKLWPPVESAIRNLVNLHLTHRQAMSQTRGMMASDPVGLLRGMADHMSQGADAMRKLADAAAPLYASLDEGQKRRLQVLVRMGGRGMMGRGMMGPGGAMMRDSSDNDDDDDDRDER